MLSSMFPLHCGECIPEKINPKQIGELSRLAADTYSWVESAWPSDQIWLTEMHVDGHVNAGEKWRCQEQK
jgi:hypothetical protein